MNPQQYADLLMYISKNNGWGDGMYENSAVRKRKVFKYIDSCFDTRDSHVWRVALRESGGNDERTFRIESDKDIEELYRYLDEEKQ